jgi:hypothetical protein
MRLQHMWACSGDHSEALEQLAHFRSKYMPWTCSNLISWRLPIPQGLYIPGFFCLYSFQVVHVSDQHQCQNIFKEVESVLPPVPLLNCADVRGNTSISKIRKAYSQHVCRAHNNTFYTYIPCKIKHCMATSHVIVKGCLIIQCQQWRNCPALFHPCQLAWRK